MFENDDDEIEERRDICSLNLDGGPPLEELAEEDCWLLGPIELRLVEIADAFVAGRTAGKLGFEAGGQIAAGTGGETERVALRDLFARAGPSR